MATDSELDRLIPALVRTYRLAHGLRPGAWTEEQVIAWARAQVVEPGDDLSLRTWLDALVHDAHYREEMARAAAQATAQDPRGFVIQVRDGSGAWQTRHELGSWSTAASAQRVVEIERREGGLAALGPLEWRVIHEGLL